MFTIARLMRASALSIFLAAEAGALPTPPQLLQADEVAALVEKAETKADHLKLAEHYAAEAGMLEADASHHEGLAKSYGRRNLPARIRSLNRGMANHCRNLGKSLHHAARASGELAKAHRAMAESAEK